MQHSWWIGVVHCLIAAQLPWTSLGLSVKFPFNKPIYVAMGRTLVLEAQFVLQPGENIRLVTWDHKKASIETRLVTNYKPIDSRISLDKNRALLRLTGVKESDYGFYTVTVTDDKGDQTSASVEVRRVEKPPVVVLSLECSMVTEGSQWDSPVFSWWVDGVEVTNETANLSADGSKLHLSGSLASNYTCIVDSSQGTSRVQHLRAPDPDTDPVPKPNQEPKCPYIVFIVVLALLAAIILGCCFWMLRRRMRPNQNRSGS